MEPPKTKPPAPPMISQHNYASVSQSNELIMCKYNGSQQRSQLPAAQIVHGNNQRRQTHSVWYQVRRFTAYWYTKHIQGSRYAEWCHDPQTLLRGATRVVLFDDDGWLLMRLPTPQPRALGNPLNAVTNIKKIHKDWSGLDAALSAYCDGAAAHGRRPRRRVRVAPGGYHVLAFENAERSQTVLMEIDVVGELVFYHECLRCQDLTCQTCVEVLNIAVSFGKEHTRVDD